MSIRFLARVPQGWQVTSQVTPFRFPAGEWHLKNTENDETPLGAVVYWEGNVDDLVILGLWADYARSKGARTVAYIPYFPAARADRGVPFGAKVYADMVNSFNLDEVVVFDPHSPVIVELLNNVRVVDSTRAVRMAVAGRASTAADNGYVGVIAPDKGAVERAQHVADALHLPLFRATKERDFETGHLTKFSVEELPAEGRLLLVDDIAEAGGTFVGLADAAELPRERISLWVSHGSFTGRAPQLAERFGNIYTTDSMVNARNEAIGAHVVPVLPHMLMG